MSEIKNDEKLTWNPHLELVFKENAEKAQSLSWCYYNASLFFNKRSQGIDIPAIIISTLSGSLSLSAERLFGKYAEIAMIICGFLSIIVSILNTLSSYYTYQKKSENCRACSVDYSRLFRFIKTELALPVEQRSDPTSLRKYVNDTYERLNEISVNIPEHIISKYKKRFYKEKNGYSHPEICNGLEPINIVSLQNPTIEKSSIEIEVKDEE